MFDADHLREEIEKGFEVVHAEPSAFAPTGERFVTIGHQCDGKPSQPGTVDECQARELGFDEETAYWSALAAFRQYAEGKTGRLYWRSVPSLDWIDGGRRCDYWIRLLISDKPVLAKAA